MKPEPIFDVHQLAHVEVYTPDPEGTLWFFHDLLGMEVTKQEGQSVYSAGLRGLVPPHPEDH